MADNIIWTPSMHPGEVGYYDVPNVQIPWGITGSGIDRASIDTYSGICQIVKAINGTYQNYLWTGGVTYTGGVGKLIRDMTALKDAIDDLRSRKGLAAYPWSVSFAVGKRIKPRCFYELRDAIPRYMNVRWPNPLEWMPHHYYAVPTILEGVWNGEVPWMYFYMVQTAGTTGDTEPAWPDTPGYSFWDGTVVWKHYPREW